MSDATSSLAPVLLALTPQEAARALWTMTKEGRIPHVVLNRSVRNVKDQSGQVHERACETVIYPVDLLRRWLEAQATGAGKNDNSVDKTPGTA